MGAKEPNVKLVQGVQLGEPDAAPASGRPAATIQNPLELVKDMPVDVEVKLGSATLTVEKILELKAGAVIALDRAVDEPVDVYVNGKLVARGQLVASDDAFGVRLTEILVSR
jgi:flagellar motor switch protein FliN/FliY